MSQDTNLTSLVINKMTKAQYDSLQNKNANELYFITDNSGIIAGTGLALTGYTLNHSNAVVAGTIGSSSASSGSTIAIPYVSYDAQGHITGGGTHSHTISNVTIDKIQTTAADNNTEYGLISTVVSDSHTTPETVYQSDLLSFNISTSTGVNLNVGTAGTQGRLTLYSDVVSANGYTELVSGAGGSSARVITFPDATGTVALTSDIPSVSSWALAANKPSYAFSELTSHPTSLGGYGITDAYTKTEVDGMVSGVLHYKGTKATVSALPNSGNTTGDVWHITADGSEYAWDGTTWQELGTATDLSGYVPITRTINGKALSSDISLTASDVSALPSNTTYVSSFNGSTGAITYTAPVTSVNGQTGAVSLTIPTVPTNVSDFTNDAGYLTSYTETDPTVPAWAKASSKPTYTASEVGALADTTTYVSSFNGSTGAVTYTAPVTSVNGQTGAVTVTNTTYTISISGNVITLTPSSGTAQTITLPVYNGGVE